MKVNLLTLSVTVIIWASGALAFDPADLKKLRDTFECANCSLFDADLRGVDLEGADLRGANLSRAWMSRTDLCNTILPTDTGWERRMDNCQDD